MEILKCTLKIISILTSLYSVWLLFGATKIKAPYNDGDLESGMPIVTQDDKTGETLSVENPIKTSELQAEQNRSAIIFTTIAVICQGILSFLP